MANILITGGAGYIGNVIANLALQRGFRVKVVDLLWFDKDVPLFYASHPCYEFIKGDICEDSVLDNALRGVDYVIHTAAVVGEPATKKFPELTREVNYEASIKLINKAKQAGIRGLVFFSTCSNYGISDGIVTEETPLNPLSLYAETKVRIERYLMDKVKNLNWIIFRLSTVYGASPRMRFDLTVNDFTMNAYFNRFLKIFRPYTYRPYIHVFDVANVVMHVIEKFREIKNDVYNVGFRGENHQKIQIAEIVERYVSDAKIEIVNKGADVRDYQVDFSKLEKSLGIEKTYKVEDGVEEVLSLLKRGTINNPMEMKYYNTCPDIGERKNGIRV